MNVSELGLVTPAGKVVWGKIVLVIFLKQSVIIFITSSSVVSFVYTFFGAGKYAQVTNNPENDGCINAVLLV